MFAKMINNLCYLNSVQVVLSFFDDTLREKVKINMTVKLMSFEEENFSDNNLMKILMIVM